MTTKKRMKSYYSSFLISYPPFRKWFHPCIGETLHRTVKIERKGHNLEIIYWHWIQYGKSTCNKHSFYHQINEMRRSQRFIGDRAFLRITFMVLPIPFNCISLPTLVTIKFFYNFPTSTLMVLPVILGNISFSACFAIIRLYSGVYALVGIKFHPTVERFVT